MSERALDTSVLIGTADGELIYVPLAGVTRHGLVTGATGTGKTNTLQTLAEGLAREGVSVLAPDVSGDVAGIAALRYNGAHDTLTAKGPIRTSVCVQPAFWDVFGQAGYPLRTTVANLGPKRLSLILSLNQRQEGVLNIAFRIAEEQQLLLIDLQDLRAVLGAIAERNAEYRSTVGTLLRQLIAFDEDGLSAFLGEPLLDIRDLMEADGGRGAFVNILSAENLVKWPKLYAIVMLWLLLELDRSLPIISSQLAPRLVVFLDEAHLLTRYAPKHFIERLPQLLDTLRFKGVGVFFVTASAADLPTEVAQQLGNLVRHGQHALTTAEQRAVSLIDKGRSYGQLAPHLVGELRMGEALVSIVDGDGKANQFKRTLIRQSPAQSTALAPQERRSMQAQSPLGSKYQARDLAVTYGLLQKQIAVSETLDPSVPRTKSKVRELLRRLLRMTKN
jgi:DNA helicase HerA-like ATPase